MASLAEIYEWFMTGKKPTQPQFWATFGSFRHKEETIPQSAISNLTTVLAAKTENTQFNAHKVATDAHKELFDLKQSLTDKGAQGGYAPLNEFTKLASAYLDIVDDLVTGGSTSVASAETVKTLKNSIDGINTLLTSNDLNLDTVQEIVDAIKTVQLSLTSILVNNLTSGGTTKALTAEMGKTLKGLIDALTTTVANLSFSVVTTSKPILSTALATQNVAGIVTYINALSPVLVVATNEIVKFNTTDTGRVFELKLRGRSFGVGQPAIVAADVFEVTDFLNKDIKLSNYPNTRNDGQLPTNKVLSTDASGNIKLYSMAVSPAPYINELVPDSYLPSTTGNIRIHGDFFTPAMCDRVSNPTAIVIGGVTTIHYATFVSSQELLINVTTGNVEGSFPCTLNNGLSTTKANALLISYGNVFSPIETDFLVSQGAPDISIKGEIHLTIFQSGVKLRIKETIFKTVPNKNYKIIWNWKVSPLGSTTSVGGYDTETQYVGLSRVSDGASIYRVGMGAYNGGTMWSAFNDYLGAGLQGYNSDIASEVASNWAFQRTNGIWVLLRDGLPFKTISYQENGEMYVVFGTRSLDLVNIKIVTI
jgi:hypothetical protein